MIKYVLAILALCALPVAAQAMDKDGIISFCEKSDAPQAGMQADGKAASADVMALEPGAYAAPSGLTIELLENNNYIMTLPSGAFAGGCSKEQLSEVLQNNNLSLEGTQKK